ncbi:MAG: hypothetical protein ACTHMS_16865 [Jatrophihabitans sp.]|uniref:hypothetical protein n=1 Tax=Jatrophihabitans sp. TaxID=1932789 RepID=UPI003F813625
MASSARLRLLSLPLTLAVTAGMLAAVPPAANSAPPPDDTPVKLTPKGEIADEFRGADETQAGVEKLKDAYYATRLLSGDSPISLTEAASLRGKALQAARGTAHSAPPRATRGGAWTNQGPAPIVQVGRTTNTFEAVSGRTTALVIRNDGTIILGAAQGGVWTYDPANGGTWTARSNAADSQAVGALALAPSNDKIVYMGSGEANLAGDSYYGDGFYRSTDGGITWQHVSTLFTGQAVAAIVVDPTNPQHVYAATARGRGGSHRTTSPTAQPYGIYESTNGGATWTLRKGTTDEFHGATNLVMDPRHPNVLFASFWGDAIYKSTDGGRHWATAMNGLPAGDFNAAGSRFALTISDPAGATAPTLYTGFDYNVGSGRHPAVVYKSTDGGANWVQTANGSGINSISDYCSTQCFYDNVLAADPSNPNTIYVLGCYGYNFSPASGGIFRSTDGGQTWKNLGYDLHPDFHAFAFQANDLSHIAIGNDGGVWDSHTGGGRTAPTDPLSAADWQDLNGQVNPNTAALIHATGLSISQFDSIAVVPNVPGQYWGGTQDNGTLRKSTANQRWFDQSSGDGGQVVVDQTTPNTVNPAVPAYVFGEYYSISPYRFDPSEANTFFGNEPIDTGIDPNDRSEFYVPMVQNRGDVNQLFLGTYRLYRTDNAEAPSAGDVTWSPISPDLTSGCTGTAPNGARGCLISAVAVADGGDGAYVGTDEGWIQVSPNAVTSDSPTWTRVGKGVLPDRPVNQIVTDRSNWRIAYAAYGGFAAATPHNSGHLFATSDGGKHWTNISGNLPDSPVNTVVVDPADAKTLYVGTDVGTFISTNGGKKWFVLGSGMPEVATWQLDYDASHGVLVAGTHGRGAYTLTNAAARPALIVSTTDTGKPVGPGSTIDETITVRNIGNADDTVSITDPVPAYTKVSVGSGGYVGGKKLHWDGVQVPAGGSASVSFQLRIDPALPASVTAIVNDGVVVKDANGVATTGSPHTTPLAPAHAATVEPTSGLEGAKVGTSATFTEQITNDGYKTDTYAVSASGGAWPTAVYDATCTTPITVTPTVAAGDTTTVCVKVDVPANAADNATNDSSFTATSTSDPSVTGSASLRTIAVASDTLLVDEDTNSPVDSAPYYKAALDANNVTYGYWDLSVNPTIPESYLAAHHNVVWFTGNSYPGPITPYERELAAFLDGGGRLLMSGQDILDQAAGTTPFVHDYLHIDWDGSEAQNDKSTADVHGVAGSPVTAGIGAVPLDHSVLQANFEDQVTPIDPATAAFTDDTGATDGLTVAAGAYKVEFLAFPFEAYGSAADKADLMGRTITWFNS